jgi:hypothetical protein
LPDSEWEEFRFHLGECDACADKVVELGFVSDALLNAVPQLSAPPQIRDRVMAVVRSESELLLASGADADRPVAQLRRGWRLPSLRVWPAAVLASALLALGIGGGALLGGDGGGVAPRTIQATCEASGCRAQMKVTSEGAKLIVAGLPAPPEGRIYQVWLDHKDGDAPEPTDRLFSVNHDKQASVAVDGDLSNVRAVLVTDEPAGGSEVPTRTPVIAAKMA